jgi:hypothetical protein
MNIIKRPTNMAEAMIAACAKKGANLEAIKRLDLRIKGYEGCKNDVGLAVEPAIKLNLRGRTYKELSLIGVVA